MADPIEQPTQPTSMANVSPMDNDAHRTRQIISGVTAGINDNRLNDTWKMLTVFGVGFIFLIVAFASGYLLLAGKDERTNDKLQGLDKSLTRIEQKLDDLIARVPPAQTPVPRR